MDNNYSTSALQSAIQEKGLRTDYVAKALGLKYQTFRNRLLGRTNFTMEEIGTLKDLLGLTNEQCVDIFFKTDAETVKKIFF